VIGAKLKIEETWEEEEKKWIKEKNKRKKVEYQENDYSGGKGFWGIEAEKDCAPRARRFFQNWSEESVVREIERKDFFLTNSNIHIVPQTFVTQPVRGRLRSPKSKKGYLFSSTSHWTAFKYGAGERETGRFTSNRGELVKNFSKRGRKVRDHLITSNAAYKWDQSISPSSCPRCTQCPQAWLHEFYPRQTHE